METVENYDVRGKVVFLRSEFNVSLSADGSLLDDTRIIASLPTLLYLREQGAKILICSHLGRPWGKRDLSKSLRHIQQALSQHAKTSVAFADDCIGEDRDRAVAQMQPGDILLLENVRYYKEENDNDEAFGKELVRGVDLYVNDAFGSCHRKHASIVAAAQQAPERCAGQLLALEVRELSMINQHKLMPSIAVIGGAKISGKDGKIHVARELLHKVDTLVIIGKISYYFLAAKGVEVGATLGCDGRGIDSPGSDLAADVDLCKQVLAEAAEHGCEVMLPIDSVISTEEGDLVRRHDQEDMLRDERAYDLGPETGKKIVDVFNTAKLVVWNGPGGYFERPPYNEGTLGIAHALQDCDAHAIVGGGDTIAAVSSVMGTVSERIHICTGGGAMLTWLMGKPLPGITALG